MALLLKGPDIDDSAAIVIAVFPPGEPTLVFGQCAIIFPGVDCRTVRQQSVCEGGPAIVSERAEPGVKRIGGIAEQIAENVIEPGGAGLVPDQVVTVAGNSAADIRSGICGIPCNN
jgi:hypothetical protein